MRRSDRLIRWGLAVAALGLGAACGKAPFLNTARSPQEGLAECQRESEADRYDRANECFELLKSRFRGTPEAVEADIEVADNYFRKKDYLVAAQAYQAFAKLYPTHPKMDYVTYRIGLSYYREAPKAVDRDQQYLEQAIQYFDQALQYYPNSPYYDVIKEKWREARTRVAQRIFYIGRFYYRTSQYLAAIPRFEEIARQYEGLGLDEKSLYFMGRALLKLDKRADALQVLMVMEEHFPQHKYTKRLAGKVGVR